MYAVIFSSQRHATDVEGYEDMAGKMVAIAQRQPGFVGVESVRGANGVGITVSYWESLEAIKQWRSNAEHLVAQRLGREKWYKNFAIKICKIEREYRFGE